MSVIVLPSAKVVGVVAIVGDDLEEEVDRGEVVGDVVGVVVDDVAAAAVVAVVAVVAAAVVVDNIIFGGDN